MKTKSVNYADKDTTCIGFLADPELPGPRPGILVAHEAPGLNDYAKRRAQMLAELGYVAFAVDLYGDGKLGRNADESIALLTPLRENPDRLRARVRAGYDALLSQPNVDAKRVGAIGYCFGGMAVLELARTGAAVAATVSFHGILGTKDVNDAKNIKGKILVLTGAADPIVPPEQVAAFQQEMSQAGVDWQVVAYGGAKHGFTNPGADLVGRPALAYHPSSDARSWAAMQAFLAETLGSDRGA